MVRFGRYKEQIFILYIRFTLPFRILVNHFKRIADSHLYVFSASVAIKEKISAETDLRLHLPAVFKQFYVYFYPAVSPAVLQVKKNGQFAKLIIMLSVGKI
jgi:hypothetical protein